METAGLVLKELIDLLHSPLMTAMESGCAELDSASILEVLEEADAISRRQERLHSRLLNFFLDPQDRRHLLGDRFLRLLLREVHLYRDGRRDRRRLADEDLTGTQVDREVYLSPSSRSDFVLSNERLRFALFVEIKVGHSERRDQLKDYWRETARKFPEYSIGGLFVTPNGIKPITAGPYDVIPLSYREIARLLDDSVKTLPKSVQTRCAPMVAQYAGAIRRWYVKDPKLNDIAWDIYRKFPTGLAKLPNYRPSVQLYKKMSELIEGGPKMTVVYDHEPEQDSDDIEIQFVPSEWDEVKRLRRAGTTEKSCDGRLAVLWIGVFPQHEQPLWRSMVIGLAIAEGAKETDFKAVISAVRRAALQSSAGTSTTEKQAALDWTDVWMKIIASAQEIETLRRDQLFSKIDQRWGQFIDAEFPKIKKLMKELAN